MRAGRILEDFKTTAGSDWISPEARDLALRRALSEYTRWRPVKRRIGEGRLALAAAAGATTVYLAGGFWSIGQTIRLDVGGFHEEAATITDLSYADDDTIQGDANLFYAPFPPVAVTLAAGLTTGKAAGGLAVPYVGGVETLGLAIVAGQGRYRLPNDFYAVDQTSLDVALGLRPAQRTVHFYDGVYAMSPLLSGTGIGRRQDFQGSIFYPALGVAAGSYVIPRDATPLSHTWTIRNDSPPMLTVDPVPGNPVRYQFEYQAQHLISTVPEKDADILLAFAASFALRAEATKASQNLTWSEGGASENWGSLATSMTTVADQHWAFAMERLQARPICVFG